MIPTRGDWEMLHWAVGLLVGIGSKYGTVDIKIYYDQYRIRIDRVTPEVREEPYETTPEGDQFLRDFIIKWMKERGFHVPAAATPSELLEAIADQANTGGGGG
jgi:hypothetical protein